MDRVATRSAAVAARNKECHAHVFVVLDGNNQALIAAYPLETIDFDATDLPPKVVAAFDEAIKCHAQACYMAAAIMVRKTLEEVCHERGATRRQPQGPY